MMTKQTKLLLGVAVLGTAGYFYWKSKQTKAFANLSVNPKCPQGQIWGWIEYPSANPPKASHWGCVIDE